MESLNEQANDTGQNQDHKENQSPPMSLAKKKNEQNSGEKQKAFLLKNGSPISENQTKTTEFSGNEADNGLKTILQKSPKKPKSLMPVPKLPSQEKRAEASLKRLKVKVEALNTAPKITKLIRADVKGGLKVALEAMRFATEDLEIRSFLKMYDKIPIGDRNRLSWEAISLAAKVNPKHLLGSIRLAILNHCENRSRFIAISNHPDVMNKRIEFAKMAGGEKDRTAVDIYNGFLSSPKGPTFVGKQVAVYNAGGGGKGPESEEGNISENTSTTTNDFDYLFPNPGDIQNKLVPIRQRLLEKK